jgi:hypothetical protein
MLRDWILEGMNRDWLVVSSRGFLDSEAFQFNEEVSREADRRFRSARFAD